MKFFRKIEEGESWTSAFIGYKTIQFYKGIDDYQSAKGFRIGINFKKLLIKIDLLPMNHDKKNSKDTL